MMPLSGHDIAILHDGLPAMPPAALVERLRRMVLEDERYSDLLAQLEAIARDAGLPASHTHRLQAAWDLQEDLTHLLDVEGWQDPCELLDPDGRRRIDLRRLAALAQARAQQPDPPPALATVREKLARAVAELDADRALVETFLGQLLARSPSRAREMLRHLSREYRERRTSATRDAATR